MTMLSQYLRAERVDKSDSPSFYVPGLEDWTELGAARGNPRKIGPRAQSVVDDLPIDGTFDDEL